MEGPEELFTMLNNNLTITFKKMVNKRVITNK
jgi:hypothetical protein